MKILVMVVGPIQTNCYLVYDEDTKDAMVVDPGFDGERILEAVRENGLNVKYIVNTHAHMDHVGADMEVKEATGAPLLLHRLDAPLLEEFREMHMRKHSARQREIVADMTLEEGQVLEIGKARFTVLHTPGHSPGGVCLVGEGVCFCGDTLFQGSVGRTDFMGGSFEALKASIQNKLYCLDDATPVFPGHGDATTVGAEKWGNPFVRAE
ncbi:MAG: MBL fold metallo-hydrolase [Peptococcaceae bacterium]|jgi:glyoxylase-like metal-dependent hydrolase (beta-lactamase superfamily II)|nr:MBL fold metallo-hydrolase [Peptococcaceae bacterium]